MFPDFFKSVFRLHKRRRFDKTYRKPANLGEAGGTHGEDFSSPCRTPC